jgi:hypothetical protein
MDDLCLFPLYVSNRSNPFFIRVVMLTLPKLINVSHGFLHVLECFERLKNLNMIYIVMDFKGL